MRNQFRFVFSLLVLVPAIVAAQNRVDWAHKKGLVRTDGAIVVQTPSSPTASRTATRNPTGNNVRIASNVASQPPLLVVEGGGSSDPYNYAIRLANGYVMAQVGTSSKWVEYTWTEFNRIFTFTDDPLTSVRSSFWNKTYLNDAYPTYVVTQHGQSPGMSVVGNASSIPESTGVQNEANGVTVWITHSFSASFSYYYKSPNPYPVQSWHYVTDERGALAVTAQIGSLAISSGAEDSWSGYERELCYPAYYSVFDPAVGRYELRPGDNDAPYAPYSGGSQQCNYRDRVRDRKWLRLAYVSLEKINVPGAYNVLCVRAAYNSHYATLPQSVIYESCRAGSSATGRAIDIAPTDRILLSASGLVFIDGKNSVSSAAADFTSSSALFSTPSDITNAYKNIKYK